MRQVPRETVAYIYNLLPDFSDSARRSLASRRLGDERLTAHSPPGRLLPTSDGTQPHPQKNRKGHPNIIN